MRILIVTSYNNGKIAPFISEQVDALVLSGGTVEYFLVKGKGIKGYLKNMLPLRRKIRSFRPDIVHAHYGLCGLLACLASHWPFATGHQPVVTTYHGSDINSQKARRFSKIAMRLSAWNIFVSQRTMAIALGNHQSSIAPAINRRSSLIPCGINLPKSAAECPDMSHVLETGKYHVLFAGAFNNAVKDPELAKAVVALLNEKQETRNEKQVQLIELKGYSRDEVNALMYACDAFLMTSKTEGSPQVIKEAMACGCPIVSVDVGDVKERFSTINCSDEGASSKLLDGCFVANTRELEELAELLLKAIAHGRTSGREKILSDGLTNEQVAEKLMEIYKGLLKM